jgi:hypothetical protein
MPNDDQAAMRRYRAADLPEDSLGGWLSTT